MFTSSKVEDTNILRLKRYLLYCHIPAENWVGCIFGFHPQPSISLYIFYSAFSCDVAHKRIFFFFLTMFRFDESVVLGHDFLFWCHSLGYSCVKEDTNDGVGLQELVWFDNLVSENQKKANIIVSALATANAYDDQVWFENIIENRKLSEGHPGNKDMQDEPLGMIDFEDEERFENFKRQTEMVLAVIYNLGGYLGFP